MSLWRFKEGSERGRWLVGSEVSAYLLWIGLPLLMLLAAIVAINVAGSADSSR